MNKEYIEALGRIKAQMTPERFEEFENSLDLIIDIFLDDYFNQFYESPEV